MSADQPAIVLVRPQLGENIGACARAMLNCGLMQMRIVAPRDGWPNASAYPTAAGADAVAVGVLKEATAGLGVTAGSEVVYNRKTKEMTVKHLAGFGFRRDFGGTVRACSRSVYGEADAIAGSTHRPSLEVGVPFLSASGYQKGSGARGFKVTLSAGASLVPFLSDQSLFTVRETPSFTVPVSDDVAQAIEAALASSSESAQKWTSKVARVFRYPESEGS